MMQGLIFDIKEFALNDGGGIRSTVFFKGCPLRCVWCHNPEGLSPKRELYVKQKGCLHCGLCRKPCTHPDCQGLGRCLHICPKNLVSVAGVEWESGALAEKLLRQTDIYRETGGGVTLSGGEPLLQWQFAAELLDRLHGKVHTAIETSGYAEAEAFRAVIDRCDFVYMDLKLMDLERHRHYTGVSNEPILENLERLKKSGRPFRIRIPVIPGVNDSDENFEQTALRLLDAENLEQVELLPYHVTAGAKYEMVGLSYQPEFDTAAAPNLNTELFRRFGLKCTHL